MPRGTLPAHRTLIALVALKVLLAGLLLTGALFPDLGGFAGKGMAFRLPIFLAPALIVPIRWLLGRPWNVGLDVALTAPFLLDTLGNAVGLYDHWNPTDDVLHFVNWVFLIWGFTTAIRPGHERTRALLWTAGTGIGSMAIIGWEIAEYAVMKAGTVGLNLTYGDTLGDLFLSTCGGALGALLAVNAWPRRERSASAERTPPGGR